MASKVSINLNLPSIGCGRSDAVEQSTSIKSESSRAIGEPIQIDAEPVVQEEYNVAGKNGHKTAKRVDLTNRRVRFEDTVTIVKYSDSPNRKGNLLV